jgi:NitT/TauT family transport system substrate-binding protein
MKSMFLLAAMVSSLCAQPVAAQAPEKVVFSTNWKAQAEHGGFYQAVADGSYRKCGLDVEIRQGGPSVNNRPLLPVGKIDFLMGGNLLQAFDMVKQKIPTVVVAAHFQKDPQGMLAHPGQGYEKFEDLKKAPVLFIASYSLSSFYQWMKSQYGFREEQVKPYNFSLAPFLADKNIVQQGYLSSEPYAIEKKAGFKPTALMLADHGWPPYACTIVCMSKTLKERPQAVAAFVRASMEGWKSYLKGDPTAANALIKKDNPAMTDDEIAVSIRLMNQHGLVGGGDAARLGIGTITEARLKKTYDMMVAMKLLDPAKVDHRKTFTTEFIKDVKVMP